MDWEGLLILSHKEPLIRIHMDDPYASEMLASSLGYIASNQSLVIVCVGTDRSTGDALGPLIGSKLLETKNINLTIYGSLEEPVHALNLDQTVDVVKKQHPNSLVIAIDACLGKTENVGYISLKEGPLKPGTGVNKSLPSIGDYHLIGVVNVGGLMEYFVLQNTRLSFVMKMSNVISKAIRLSCDDLIINRA